MIIGRTSKTCEANSNINFLTKSRYYHISQLARNFLLENNIKSLPIKFFEIVKSNQWNIIKFSMIKQFNIHEYNIAMKDNLGFTQLSDNKYCIFYDDTASEHQQRFTIAHEIGHIILNHFNVPIENREQEANMFAARVLMPMCVLYECQVSNPEEISNLCNVSLISATYRYKRLSMLKSRNKFYKDKNEIKLKSKFKKFIKNYKKSLITK